ncbi:MAG: hypothetical protein ABI467_24395 [Kofleriaceae bacterium]
MNSSDDVSASGPAWAAILAATVGCACFGVLVDVSEAFKGFSRALSFYEPTGDLSGKSTLAVAAWLATWIILHSCWKGRNIERPSRVALVSGLLVLVALVTTFPPFFGLFTSGS